VTERRIVVLAFFAFLAVGAAVILVYASQPASNPSIQSGLGPATTRPHRATSSTTPGTLPQPPIEVKGEVATSPTAPKATDGPKPTVTTTRRGRAPSLFGILAAPTVSPGTAKPAPAVATSPPGTTRTSPPTTKPDPTTTKPAPTTTKPAPTTAAPTTTKPAPTTAPPTTAAPTTTKPAPTTAPPTTAAPTTTAPPTTTQPKPILPPVLPPLLPIF
jgi:hypothetical protein